MPPAPCVSAVSRVLSPFPPRHRLSSCLRSHAISSAFLFLSGSDISLVSRLFVYTPCVKSTAKEHQGARRHCAGRKSSRDETDVAANALQILKISSPLIIRAECTSVAFLYIRRMSRFWRLNESRDNLIRRIRRGRNDTRMNVLLQCR